PVKHTTLGNSYSDFCYLHVYTYKAHKPPQVNGRKLGKRDKARENSLFLVKDLLPVNQERSHTERQRRQEALSCIKEELHLIL
ncbi:hypothetical protein HAX54_046310, partial [Datura stramonium]|nr:hypothetical protein [Datura stramonium]